MPRLVELFLIFLAYFQSSSSALTTNGAYFDRKISTKMSVAGQDEATTLPSGIIDQQVDLSTGVSAQILHGKPKKSSTLPPLAFVHGSFHAAWCWEEHYMPYFLSLGYPVIALSLRGTGGTFAGEGVRKVQIQLHAKDIQAFLEKIPDLLGTDTKPVLITHSFGGLGVMKCLEMFPDEPSKLAGIVIMCSVPPSGNGPMTMRFLRRSLVDSWKITAGFAMKRCIQNDSLCRDLFFGGNKFVREDGSVEDYGVSDEDIKRFQANFARDTEAIIDIGDLLNHLPSKTAIDGKAPGLSSFPPCLVLGASRDFIVDQEGNEETAAYFGLESPTIIESPHDVMLGKDWKNGADTIRQWVENSV